jgi:polar amino acid transport system substrate-binding protein
MRQAARCAGLVLSLLASACEFPRDAAGGLERARGGVLRVGVTANPPWVVGPAGEPSGLEPDLIRAWSRQLGARIVWVDGSESRLVAMLRHRELDVLLGGLGADSPWGSVVGFTRPYASARGEAADPQGDHVMAVSPGESALALALDLFLQARRADVARELARSDAR